MRAHASCPHSLTEPCFPLRRLPAVTQAAAGARGARTASRSVRRRPGARPPAARRPPGSRPGPWPQIRPPTRRSCWARPPAVRGPPRTPGTLRNPARTARAGARRLELPLRLCARARWRARGLATRGPAPAVDAESLEALDQTFTVKRAPACSTCSYSKQNCTVLTSL